MKYIQRIIDETIDKKFLAFNAINIVGPKGCGKTRTAKERCKTIIEFQDEEKREGYLNIAETAPTLFFKNEKPILFDEWQDAPKIWGAIRKNCDDNPDAFGEYLLTGLTSKRIDTPHTGTGRISELQMYPMTLWETGESNGTVSLSEIMNNKEYDIDGKMSALKLEDLFFTVCRGGWPRCMAIANQDAKLEIARDYFKQICEKDISSVDNTKRNPEWTKAILWSYARNMATTAKRTSIYADVQSNYSVSDVSIANYIDLLQQLYVIKDIDAWTPQIRSKTAIRSAKKHIFVDTSIAMAALGINPEYFYNDLDLFGHAFENMVIRDLLVYAEAHNAKIMHYTDDTGLEADAIYQMQDGRYALIEIKTGASKIAAAEKSLLKFRDVIQKHNKSAIKNMEHQKATYREPDELIILCATASMAYTTENGVRVIPIGCLRD